MSFINLGLHKLESFRTMEGHYINSYFLKRNYLNYLIFPPQHISLFKDMFIAKGGIGKQIITHQNQLNLGCAQVFKFFGASAVFLRGEALSKAEIDITSKLKTEVMGENFFDHDIITTHFEETDIHWFRIYHQGKYFLVTDESIIFHNEGWKMNPTCPISLVDLNKILDSLSENEFKVDYLMPRCHDGEFYLSKLNKSKLLDNLRSLKGSNVKSRTIL